MNDEQKEFEKQKAKLEALVPTGTLPYTLSEAIQAVSEGALVTERVLATIVDNALARREVARLIIEWKEMRAKLNSKPKE
jgi:hypothetical protein